MKWLYLAIDLCTVIVPLCFSFHPRIRFHRTWKAFFTGCALVAVLFITWDIIFTSMNVWGFNQQYVTGVSIFNLPVEEVLFFICIPFSCVFTYYCFDKFYPVKWPRYTETAFCLILSAILLVGGFIFIDRSYTCITLISTALISLLIKFAFRTGWYGKAVSVYVLLLLPFLVVNGLLTGSGLQAPVVWYNDNENLGIRILTIPVEDIFYGFELFLFNILFYELFRRPSPSPVRI